MRVAVPALQLLLLLTACTLHASVGGKLGAAHAKPAGKPKGTNATVTAAATRGGLVTDDDGSARCGWIAPPAHGEGDGFARTCFDGLCCSVSSACMPMPRQDMLDGVRSDGEVWLPAG